jgi:hypothetical protein
MNDKAERWLAEQEIALLEEIYALESPPAPEDPREVIRVEARKVRVYERATDPPSNGPIGPITE